MSNNQNNGFINDLLNLMNSRIHWRKRQNIAHGSNGKRIIGELSDDTGVGNRNETENLIVDNIYILDCGHVNNNSLGGQCRYCDAMVCHECLKLCSNCGHPICPNHTAFANFSGTEKSYCRVCAQEISRSIKSDNIKKGILSFFIGADKE
jgi:hypothetical protein